VTTSSITRNGRTPSTRQQKLYRGLERASWKLHGKQFTFNL
jgi:hypothetical protein